MLDCSLSSRGVRAISVFLLFLPHCLSFMKLLRRSCGDWGERAFLLNTRSLPHQLFKHRFSRNPFFHAEPCGFFPRLHLEVQRRRRSITSPSRQKPPRSLFSLSWSSCVLHYYRILLSKEHQFQMEGHQVQTQQHNTSGTLQQT